MTPSRQTIIWMMMLSHFVNLLVLSEKRKDCNMEINIELIGNIIFHHLKRKEVFHGVYDHSL